MAGCWLGGCAIGVYAPPAANTPHARALVRVHDRWQPEALIEERLAVDGATASPSQVRGGALLRLAPGAHRVSLHAAYYVEAPRNAIVGRDEPVRVRCRAEERCERSVMVPVARAELVVDRVDVGGCIASIDLDARAGARFVLDVEIDGPNACRVQCARVEQDERGHDVRVACDR